MVQDPMQAIQHRVREALRCNAARQLEARGLATFGGLGDGVDGAACRAALRVASTEREASLLWGLLSGVLWTSVQVRGCGLRTASACPFCGVAHEDKARPLGLPAVAWGAGQLDPVATHGGCGHAPARPP